MSLKLSLLLYYHKKQFTEVPKHPKEQKPKLLMRKQVVRQSSNVSTDCSYICPNIALPNTEHKKTKERLLMQDLKPLMQ